MYQRIGVVGLGYVGLPLLLAYARKGYRSLGFAIDPAKPEENTKFLAAEALRGKGAILVRHGISRPGEGISWSMRHETAGFAAVIEGRSFWQ